VLLALFLGAPGLALAQTRPLQTEEAYTAPAGSLVLEVGADAIRDEPNFQTGELRGTWAAPVLRLVYSPADMVELDLEWTGWVGAFDDPTFRDATDFGDVALRAKVRFVEEASGRPAFSARFGMTLPETSFGQGLGPNTIRMSAQFLLSKHVGRFALHANAGLAIQDRPLSAHEQADFLAYGLAVDRPIREGLSAVAEVAGLGVGKGYPGADRRAEARAGLRGGRGRVGWDAAVRRGLEAADGTWGITAGFTWRIRPGRS
jgi:hypothetical protein